MSTERSLLSVVKTKDSLRVEITGSLDDVLRALHEISHKVINHMDDPEDAEAIALLFAHLAGSATNRLGELTGEAKEK